jgi:hypothetical protein
VAQDIALSRLKHGFDSRTGYAVRVAGWSSLVARRAHNPKVAGSNPAPAMICRTCSLSSAGPERSLHTREVAGSNPAASTAQRSAGIAQLVERNLAKVEVAGSSPVARSVVGKAHLAQLVRASDC